MQFVFCCNQRFLMMRRRRFSGLQNDEDDDDDDWMRVRERESSNNLQHSQINWLLFLPSRRVGREGGESGVFATKIKFVVRFLGLSFFVVFFYRAHHLTQIGWLPLWCMAMPMRSERCDSPDRQCSRERWTEGQGQGQADRLTAEWATVSAMNEWITSKRG